MINSQPKKQVICLKMFFEFSMPNILVTLDSKKVSRQESQETENMNVFERVFFR